jgi:chondroitin 4-sulfotransferase 11
MSINISDKYKCIFIHIPRAAGTSIKEALELQGRGHLPWQYYYLVYPGQWNSYIKFSVVRNPWDRVVSAYNYAKMKKSYWHDNLNKITPHPDYELLHDKRFAECCEILKNKRNLLKHESWHPQHLWIVKTKDGNDSLMVDFILRYENLENDFYDLCKKLGISNINLPRVNPSNHNHYRQYYTQETKEIIEGLYSNDIRLFKYEF